MRWGHVHPCHIKYLTWCGNKLAFSNPWLFVDTAVFSSLTWNLIPITTTNHRREICQVTGIRNGVHLCFSSLTTVLSRFDFKHFKLINNFILSCHLFIMMQEKNSSNLFQRFEQRLVWNHSESVPINKAISKKWRMEQQARSSLKIALWSLNNLEKQ